MCEFRTWALADEHQKVLPSALWAATVFANLPYIYDNIEMCPLVT
jgi:hypothetical protein